MNCEITLSYLNIAAFNAMLGTDMGTTEQEFPRELTYECPQCGTKRTFTDDGNPILIRCFQCERVLLSRTPQGTAQIKPKLNLKIADDISISGRKVKLTKDEEDRARKMLEW
jgi:hypothetical protein